MFQVNDIITYGLHGVCTISEITKKELDGKRIEYYILKPINDDNSTISIPVHNEKLTAKMRPTLSKDEIYSLIKELPKEEINWIDNENLRVKQYKELLGSGNPKKILILLKSLYLHKIEQEKMNKKLHMIDERILKNAEEVLYNQFSYSLNTSQERVQDLLLKYMPASN
ncbi:CarD family transcriptional regulator [Paludicola sp. MB14-C6]|uniref:CarD family transcriptional regulator n=1 Tax=Paludihabitans sp. MB14-C6 TaxID=3070656 RepID=UPI0027DCA35A|nr:CarD family transcriptional regulator [Paludicola sp. MB14-C6]WMJ22829.1 CarD family transcriptional regulator [Paludicola sp. MB14-C6]